MKKTIKSFAFLTSFFASCAQAEVELTDGLAHVIANSATSDLTFSIVLTADQSSLSIYTQGDNGDADLELVEINGAITDCEISYVGSSEACVIKSPDAGTYRFRVNAYEAFTNVTVVASTEVYAQQVECPALENETLLNIQSPLITQEQIGWICDELGRTETLFHQAMGSDMSTVPNDQNDLVNVNIFANQPAFMTTGQYVQDMQDSASTGIYFESNPESSVARANVNTFEAWRWADGEFFIWELAHEYVHYLDGRYNKQGTYSTTIDHHMTWWTEGLAEYIADNASPYLNVALVHSPQNFSADDIVQSGYDGEASPYDWGSMLVKYLAQERGDDLAHLRTLARSGDYEALDTWLLDWAGQVDDDFQTWQTSTLLSEFEQTATELTANSALSATSQHGLLFYVDLDAGENFSAKTEMGGGDVDIYLQKDQAPNKYDATEFMCRSNFGTTSEVCSVADAEGGRYYVLLDAPGYAVFANTQLTGSSEVLSQGIDYSLCSNEVPYSGRDSGVNADVTLVNDGSESVSIYWLNHSSGGRSSSSYATLAPGEEWTASWYLGDTVVIADAEQNCLTTYALKSGSNDLSFDGSEVAEAVDTQPTTPAEPEPTPSESSSGGAVGSSFVLIACAILFRRRQLRAVA